MADVLHLYSSALARDAGLAALPEIAWTDSHKTFSEFTSELDHMLPPDRDAKTLVDGPARFFAFACAAGWERRFSKNDETKNSDTPPFLNASDAALKAAMTLLSSWKACGLTPASVRRAANSCAKSESSAHLTPLLNELARLFDGYERRLANRCIDREDWERNLLKRLSECAKLPARLIPAGASIELHGFHRLGMFQRKVIDGLARLGHARCESVEQDRPNPQCLRMEAQGIYAEVYEIGRRVRSWIVDDRIPPSEIAVTFRDLGPYSQAVHDVFGRLGIPAFERRGEPVRFQPLIRAALSAIDACIDGLGRTALFRFLGSGTVNLQALAGSDAVPLDAAALNTLAVAAGIERFFGAECDAPQHTWLERLQRYVKEAGKRSSQPAAQGLAAIVSRLALMLPDRTVQAHAQAWLAFFDCCGLSSQGHARKVRLESEASVSGVNIEARRTEKECLSLQALETALLDIAQSPGAAAETLSLEAFASLLTAALDEQSVRSDFSDRGGVRVLNFYDMRGLRFKRVALGGLSEGFCPARGGADLLFGAGSERLLRSALGVTGASDILPRLPDEIADEERAIFDCARSCATGLLLITRPLRNSAGGEIGPSEYWSVFAGETEAAAAISPAPPLAACVTTEEAELRAAWVLAGGNAGVATREKDLALAAFSLSARLHAAARSAAIERSRNRFFVDQALHTAADGQPFELAPTRFDGQVERSIAAAVFSRLALEGTSDPLLNPGQIERLAACPFHFFTSVLGSFGQREDPAEEISPLHRGSLWHNILNRFVSERIDPLPPGHTAPLRPVDRTAALGRLQELARIELEMTAASRFVGPLGSWNIQRERLDVLLEAWLDCELTQPEDGFHPAFVEFAFGPDIRDARASGRELSVPMDAGAQSPFKLLIHGRMDRLDVRSTMHSGKPRISAVRILDYKLGYRGSYKDKTKVEALASLRSAQLPIYMCAAIETLRHMEREGLLELDLPSIYRESKAGYYSLRETPSGRRGGAAPLMEISEWPLGSMEAFLALDAFDQPENFFTQLRTLFTATANGHFAVHPAECSGTHCPARHACRYQAIPTEAAEMFGSA